jgi:hypothetical protein
LGGERQGKEGDWERVSPGKINSGPFIVATLTRTHREEISDFRFFI